MTTFISSFTIILIVGGLAYLFYKIYINPKPSPIPIPPEPSNEMGMMSGTYKSATSNYDRTNEETSPSTTLINQLVLQIFDSKGGVKKEIALPRIPKSGLSIGKSKEMSVVIPEQVISRCHCYLGEDSNGLFIVDNNSTNGIYYSKNKKKREKQLNVVEGEIYYLANIPIKFKRINPMMDIDFPDTKAKTHEYKIHNNESRILTRVS